jgi:RNA polymerase sigma-70 factor (ECF subfamily)
MAHRADRALAEALLKGEEREFERFFNDYYPRLYRFALVRTDGDTSLAEDVAQTTLMNAMRSMASYRGEASMFSWLCQIGRNEISAHFRRLSRSAPTVAADDEAIQPLLEMFEADPSDDPDMAAERLQLTQLVQEIMDHLPGNYGDALEWKYVRGESVGEIAERLGITTLAAQSLLSRARSALREALGRVAPQISGLPS